jgi:signal transduction histidine kinase
MEESTTARRAVFIRTFLSESETVCCTVEDSGTGFDVRYMSRLFDSFFTTKDSGMGIGLAMSRSIIEAHGGVLQADNESSLGGARVRFALPLNLTPPRANKETVSSNQT